MYSEFAQCRHRISTTSPESIELFVKDKGLSRIQGRRPAPSDGSPGTRNDSSHMTNRPRTASLERHEE